MSTNFYEEFFEDGFTSTQNSEKPFYKVLKDKENRHDWLKATTESLLNQSISRTQNQRENLMTYRGIPLSRQVRDRNNDDRERLNKHQRFIVNHLYDLTETKISQLTRLKPNVEVLPNNDEWNDRSSAKVVQLIIKHLWYRENIDKLVTDLQRYSKIFGETYLFVEWDKNKGDLSPEYVELRELGLDADKYAKAGKVNKYVGDIKYVHELPWRVLLHRTDRIEDCEYVIRVKFEKTEKLRDMYPKFKDDISSEDTLAMYDIESMENRFLEDTTVVFEFFHKRTDDVDKQYYAKFTQNVILEEGDETKFPEKLFSHGCLPFVRLTDLDLPTSLNGISRYETIAPMQKMYDNLSTLIMKNIYLTAHAKWMMPRGAAKISQLGNDNTVVQYQGPVAPQLVTYASNNRDVYEYRQMIKEEMQTIYGSHGISRGEVPQGITAASALQFLNELENQRSTTDVAKHGQLIVDIAKMTIAVAGDMYKVDDGRLLRIVGTDNKYDLRHFDTAHLHKSYDIRFDVSSGLPETKSAKYQRILDAMQRHPNMLSSERWEELLELGNIEKFNTLVSQAYRAADSIVEDILAKRPIKPLEEWHDFIPHWETYVKAMQSRAFNEDAEPEVIETLKNHLYMVEEAMFNKAEKNLEFEAKLATLTLFPVFSHNYPMPRSREQQLIAAQGAHNRGEPTDAQVAGTSKEEMKEIEFAKEQLKRK